MKPMRSLVLTTLAALLAGGCVSRVIGGYTESAFYRRCQDLNSVATSAAQDTGFEFRSRSSGGGSSGGSSGMHFFQNASGELVGKPTEVGKFMKALRAEFERLAGATGATCPPAITTEADAKEGAPSSFTFEYSDGPNHGTVEVSIDNGKPEPSRADLRNYQLKLKLDERVP